MTQTLTQGPSGPVAFFNIAFSFLPARAMMTAMQLDLFSALDGGPLTAAEVAGKVQASEKGTRMVLDVLVSLGMLGRQGDRYELTPASARHLVRGKDEYMGAMFERDDMWTSWGGLTEVVRTGQPVRRVEDEALASQFFPVLVKGLHVIHRDVAQRAARILAAGLPAEAHVLDVAAGSAAWSIPFAEENKKVHVTALDFPAVLETTKGYVKRHGVESQFDFLAGNLREVELGEGRFDLAILGNIVHSEGEAASREFLKKLYRSLRPGGRVVIFDMVPDDDRTGPMFPLGFALNMLLHTGEGDTYTFAQMKAWLDEAGFQRAEKIDIQYHSPMVVGTK